MKNKSDHDVKSEKNFWIDKNIFTQVQSFECSNIVQENVSEKIILKWLNIAFTQINK